jgi:hypothetical protein
MAQAGCVEISGGRQDPVVLRYPTNSSHWLCIVAPAADYYVRCIQGPVTCAPTPDGAAAHINIRGPERAEVYVFHNAGQRGLTLRFEAGDVAWIAHAPDFPDGRLL